ncbi:uncharacterized protein LOC123257558 [Drosophila ananassae]|uniref:uncharacterized protein LOC123257558 n=1 Tax=Drosophila ananassae TaxID=7217 RepID=UPI001CFF5814|nr:uncharacterized protein LOC123257558 [Drosophila ananassae]
MWNLQPGDLEPATWRLEETECTRKRTWAQMNDDDVATTAAGKGSKPTKLLCHTFVTVGVVGFLVDKKNEAVQKLETLRSQPSPHHRHHHHHGGWRLEKPLESLELTGKMRWSLSPARNLKELPLMS